VENWEGEPWGKEGQPGNWVELQASDAEKFPPANEPVILRLVANPGLLSDAPAGFTDYCCSSLQSSLSKDRLHSECVFFRRPFAQVY
jgi:hypothetical protein